LILEEYDVAAMDWERAAKHERPEPTRRKRRRRR